VVVFVAVFMVVIVIVALWTGEELGNPRVELFSRYWRPADDELLQGREPALVVVVVLGGLAQRIPAADSGNEFCLEIGEVEYVLLCECDSKTKRSTFPRVVEDQLAVGARWGPDTLGGELLNQFQSVGHAGVSTNATPTIVSRVTSAANSSSVRSSVPAGRCGSTK